METEHLMHRCGREIILFLFENRPPQYATTVYKETNITYSHITETIKVMVKAGIIEKKELDGRTNGLFLTEKGKKIAESLRFIKKTLEE